MVLDVCVSLRQTKQHQQQQQKSVQRKLYRDTSHVNVKLQFKILLDVKFSSV